MALPRSSEQIAKGREAFQKAMEDVTWSESMTSFEDEAFRSSLGETLSNYLTPRMSGLAETMSGEEANRSYGLVDTPAAFKDDEQVNVERARIAALRYNTKKHNEDVQKQFDNQSSILPYYSSMLAGSLYGGLQDPVGLGIGIATASMLGSGAVAATAGTRLAPLMTRIFTGKGFQAIAAKNLAESTMETIITETAQLGLSGETYNQPMSNRQYVMNIFTGIGLGTILGTTMETGAEYAISYGLNKRYGDKAPKIAEEIQTAALNAAHQDSVPDAAAITTIKDIEFFADRPHQNPNVFKQYDPKDPQPNYADRVWHMAEDRGRIQKVTDRGGESTVIVDGYNYAENYIASVDGKTGGTVHKIELQKGLRIFNDAQFNELKADKAGFAQFISDAISPAKSVEGRKKVRLAAQKVINEVDTFEDFLDGIVNEIGTNSRGVPDLNNLFNNALQKYGYDGFHFVVTGIEDAPHSNGIVIFNKKGEAPFYKVDRTDGLAVEYDEKMIAKVMAPDDVKFDPTDAQNSRFVQMHKGIVAAEMERLQTQKLGDQQPAMEYNYTGVDEAKAKSYADDYADEFTMEGEDVIPQEELEKVLGEHIVIKENPDIIRQAINSMVACFRKGE